jgi:hypothetical protein
MKSLMLTPLLAISLATQSGGGQIAVRAQEITGVCSVPQDRLIHSPAAVHKISRHGFNCYS